MAVPYYGDFPINHTGVQIPFNTFDSNDPSASVTMTDFANTDVHIHKNGSLTQRSSAAGVAIDIDVDGIAGNHWITIDLSDNTDAGFYAAGSEVAVRIEGTTVDGATINAFVGAFSIERAGGTIALLKLIQAAVITNAAGADVAADIIALKTVADTIAGDVVNIDGDAMRGTDSAALASVCTEARLSELDAGTGGKMANQVDVIQTDTTTDIPALIATAQTDLDTITGADGVTLATAQGLYAPNKVVPDAAGVAAGLITAIDGSTLSSIPDMATATNQTAIEADTQDIQSRLPTAISANGNMKSDMLEVNGVAFTGDGTLGSEFGPV